MTEPSTAPVKAKPTVAVSPYDLMRADVEQAEIPLLTLQHPMPGMEAYSLTFNPAFDYDTQYKQWTRQATSRTGKKEVDSTKLNRRVVAETCVQIHKSGVLMADKDGDPITFRDEDLIKMYGGSASDAVKGFIKIDGGISGLANRIVAAAGYGDDIVEADPEDPKDER